MRKRVVLVTGTPCVGKTSAARLLTAKLDGLYINLTDMALRHNLVLGKDAKRDTVIVDQARMKNKVRALIDKTDRRNVVIDGHYAPNVVPPELATFTFVIRRDPAELREFMKRRGFSEPKLTENLAAEILDVCLVEALNARTAGRTCELDATAKSAEEIANDVLEVMKHPNKCRVGVVDWLGKLESEGRLDEFLRI
jgi:adenylate kinase